MWKSEQNLRELATTWVPGMELKSLGIASSILDYRDISPVPPIAKEKV